MAEPIGDSEGGGKRLRAGEVLRNAEGSWFRVYDIGGGKLRLAPIDESGKLLAPKSQWQSPAGAFENELGQLVQTDISGGITTSRTIPWSSWAGGGGGGGGGGAGRTQFPSEKALEEAKAAEIQGLLPGQIERLEAEAEQIRGQTENLPAEREGLLAQAELYRQQAAAAYSPEERRRLTAMATRLEAEANLIIAQTERVGLPDPDPLGAAATLTNQFLAEVQAGRLSAEQAWNQMQVHFKQWEAETTSAGMALTQATEEERAVREREIAEGQRQLGLQQEAGRRAQTIARDILPSSIPGLRGLNLPMAGQMPVPQVNIQQLLSQGLPGLAQTTPIGTGPTGIGQVPLPTTPTFPELQMFPGPTAPDIGPLVAAGAAGQLPGQMPLGPLGVPPFIEPHRVVGAR